MEAKSTILCAQNLKKSFAQGQGTLHVINDITVRFVQGQSYAITGVSGSGKSTFMHLLAGLDSPTSGTISYNNTDLATLDQAARMNFLNKQIGLVFQEPYLIRELSVLENCMIKGLIADESSKLEIERAMALLTTAGLADKTYCKPASLSGGQQQRVALIRAIFNKPAFLLADEPTGSLDEDTGQEIINLLLQCQKEWNMGLIISSHDPNVFNRMEHIYHLHNGQLELSNFNKN